RFPLDELLTLADQTLLDRFGHWFIPDRDPRLIRRNALIAAGNSGQDSLVPLVAPYAGHPDWLLRAHALWALGRLGGRVAEAVIEDRARAESDPRVQNEIPESLSPSPAGT
ncbi:MAG TPA: HEAT repeat domain-containing protein, partial [Acidimicrobiia bacterium]|nr:HEAT repeat domain-containing protein [Acidimicrobiia bacterium]